MPQTAETQIVITGEDRSKQAFSQAENSLESLERQTRELQQATRATATALGLSGNAAREASTSFTSLGRQIFQSQEQAKKFGGVFRSLDGRLRESNGRFVKGREAVAGLDTGCRRRDPRDWYSNAFGRKFKQRSWRDRNRCGYTAVGKAQR